MRSHKTQIGWIANNLCPRTGIRGSPITSIEMRQLINALKTNHSLIAFTFSPKRVEKLALVSELFESFMQHEPLQELRLATEFQLSEDNLAKLKQLITAHTTLDSLTLRYKVCNEAQLKRFTDTLENCEQLKKFVCAINGIPDNTLLDIIIKLIRYNHLQSIIVNPENVTKKQMADLVSAMELNIHPNLRHLGLTASSYEAGALPILFNYLEKNATLTELGLGDITDINDFKQLVDVMSKNTTLTSLSFEITPSEEFFNASYKLISNNNTLKVFEYFTEYSKLESSPELMKLKKLANSIEKKISDKVAVNKARKNSLQANTTADNEHSKKRSAYQAVLTPSDSVLHNKRQRPSADEDTSRNTTSPSEGSPSNTTIHVKS